METVKNVAKELRGATTTSQFAPGHEPPIQHQPPPGLEAEMRPRPMYDQLPTHPAHLCHPSTTTTTTPGTGVPKPEAETSATAKAAAAFTLPSEKHALATYSTYKPANKLCCLKAVITGGDSGIGRSVAVLYAMEGADVTIGYLPSEETDARETQRIIQDVYHRKCYLCPGDLTHPDQCKKLVDCAMKQMGAINILVNNCAYQMTVDRIEDLSTEQWEHTFRTNIFSYFHMTKYALPHMGPGDSIVNNSSINHYIGKPNLLDYTSTKGAIIAFTRALANQVCDRQIRVNAVCPGPVWTPFVVSGMGSGDQEKLKETPYGRCSQPSEIATSFVFLASMDSSAFNGQTLHPNCGTIVGN